MNIALIGFSTTGKSTVGRILAERLGWHFLDTDAEIERRAGKRIPEIFGEDGEPVFREIERTVIAELADADRHVLSTGGGVVLDPENRRDLRRGSFVVLLEASPDSIVSRVRREMAGGAVRPLLAGDDPVARVQALKEYRQRFYAEAAHWTVYTDLLSPDEVADEVHRAFERYGKRSAASGISDDGARGTEAAAPYCDTNGATALVQAPGGSYPIFVGHGILRELGQRIRNLGSEGRCWVLADQNVLGHAERAVASIRDARFPTDLIPVASGEEQKTLESVHRLYDELLARRVERRDVIVAVGGGVLGDVAGFVAATILRGIALVHVPTTLLAMVDSSIGGKTGVNHAHGKNLIGAFYQPKLVISDIETLATLPARHRLAGWAEVIKHALIADAALLEDLASHAEAAVSLEPYWTALLIGRSAAIKARIVTADERETGLRMLLNYGHTVGHAVEQSAGYGTYLHGEAVAIGMQAAGLISLAQGLLAEADLFRQSAVLRQYLLPDHAQVAPEDVLQALQFDKKVRAATVHWVLLSRVGVAAVHSDVPPNVVAEAVRAIAHPG